MSQDHKANMLYNRHLDFSVTDGNKELEDAKGNYPAMKSLLVERWGNVDTVCDQYLEGIKEVAMPADPRDKVGMLAYVKNAYGKLVTLTKLEAERGQPVPGLADYYLSNCFLRKVHRLLPDDLGLDFSMKLQESGENYYLMKGRAYMDRIISLLRFYYKSLEIALEDRPDLPIIMKSGLVLDVHGVDVDLTHVNEELDELRALDRVDEACSAEMIGSVNIRTGSNKTFDNILAIEKTPKLTVQAN